MIFVCPECGGSGRGESCEFRQRYYPIVCPKCQGKKIAIQEIDLDVPDGYEFHELGAETIWFYSKTPIHFIARELPHKIGDMWVCDKCLGGGVYSDLEDMGGFTVECECKGIKAELIEIQYKDKLILTWREV